MTTTNTPEISAQMGPHLLAMSKLHLIDHVQMMHNALGAVHSLAIPSASDGPDGLNILARNDFVDLLEILNDRLGMALEMEKIRNRY